MEGRNDQPGRDRVSNVGALTARRITTRIGYRKGIYRP
jgi:hypothetical protein